jgi:hypothetical protein
VRGGAGACAEEGGEHRRCVMSAAEVIELIKKLPPEERVKLREYFSKDPSHSAPQVRYIPAADAEKIADKVFTKNAELFRRLAE